MPPIPAQHRRYNTYQNPNMGFTIKQQSILRKKLKLASSNSKEKKHVIFNPANVAMVAGGAQLFNPLISIPQGTSVGSRIGTQIYLDKIDFKIMLSSQLVTAVNTTLRYHIYLFWSDTAINSASAAWTAVTNGNLQTTLPLLGGTGSGTVVQAHLNPDASVKVREYMGVIQCDQTTVVNEKSLAFSVKFGHKKIQYLADGTGAFLDNKNLYFVITSDYSGATAGTSTAGSCSCTYQVFFQE